MEHPARDRPELLTLPNGIAAGRILLRRYRPGDGDSFFAGLAPHRDELMQWMEWPVRHQTVEDSESYATRMHAEFALRKSMPMGIWDRSTGVFLGGAGFHAPDWTTPKAEIGYFLVPPARGAGIAADVVRLQVHYAFDHMKVNRIWGGCDPENDGSASVMRRAGLREEGRLRAHERNHHGQLRDTLVFGLAVFDFDAWVDGWCRSPW
ncbi:MAG: GNAT family N-acetyltransferase [Burkholderiaceae bacterium]